jgi:hypothetical protein
MITLTLIYFCRRFILQYRKKQQAAVQAVTTM